MQHNISSQITWNEKHLACRHVLMLYWGYNTKQTTCLCLTYFEVLNFLSMLWMTVWKNNISRHYSLSIGKGTGASLLFAWPKDGFFRSRCLPECPAAHPAHTTTPRKGWGRISAITMQSRTQRILCGSFSMQTQKLDDDCIVLKLK